MLPVMRRRTLRDLREIRRQHRLLWSTSSPAGIDGGHGEPIWPNMLVLQMRVQCRIGQVGLPAEATFMVSARGVFGAPLASAINVVV